MPYYVAANVFICESYFHSVLLDAVKDRYLCIPNDVFRRVAPWIRESVGATEELVPSNTAALPSNVADLLSTLTKEGVLTSDAQRANPCARERIARASVTLGSASSKETRASKISKYLHACQLIAAAARADRRLRHTPILDTIRHVRERRQAQRLPTDKFDMAKAGRLLETATAIRWCYPRDYLCLFDCLALLEYLAMNKLFPSWVFGVTTDPFQAHCWLQEGDVLLNDSLARTSCYQPIMVV